jgi:predicted secreted hydrolase
MDHEFSSSFLERDQAGWDWFALQLGDGSELMLYGLRRRDGTYDPHSSGTVVREGQASPLAASEFTMTPVDWWTSPDSDARYPVRWRVAVPARDMALEVRAVFPSQELRTERSTRVTYWEGMVDATGTRGGANVSGPGYLEMTGYAGQSPGEALR